MPDIQKLHGQCACGAVRFSADGPFREGLACHCTTCRRQSGHFIVATATDKSKLNIEETGELVWYRASDAAKRGFCSTCGSFLFWLPDERSHVAIMLGAVDDAGDIRLARHIHASEKGTYYEITDGIPVIADGR